MNKTKPLSPKEIIQRKRDLLPSEVIEAFNDTIAKHFSDGEATFKADEVIAAIMSRLNISRQEIFDKHYLDVEEIFGDAGWCAEYDKPAYNETGDAHFTFTSDEDC